MCQTCRNQTADFSSLVVLRNEYLSAGRSESRNTLKEIVFFCRKVRKFRFQDEKDSDYWTTAFVQFEDVNSAERGVKTLNQYNTISADLVSDVLKLYQMFEETIPALACQRSLISIQYSRRLSKEKLCEYFSKYGTLNLECFGKMSFISYSSFNACLAAEVDNNNWNDNTNYFIVETVKNFKEYLLAFLMASYNKFDINFNLENELVSIPKSFPKSGFCKIVSQLTQAFLEDMQSSEHSTIPYNTEDSKFMMVIPKDLKAADSEISPLQIDSPSLQISLNKDCIEDFTQSLNCDNSVPYVNDNFYMKASCQYMPQNYEYDCSISNQMLNIPENYGTFSKNIGESCVLPCDYDDQSYAYYLQSEYEYDPDNLDSCFQDSEASYQTVIDVPKKVSAIVAEHFEKYGKKMDTYFSDLKASPNQRYERMDQSPCLNNGVQVTTEKTPKSKKDEQVSTGIFTSDLDKDFPTLQCAEKKPNAEKKLKFKKAKSKPLPLIFDTPKYCRKNFRSKFPGTQNTK